MKLTHDNMVNDKNLAIIDAVSGKVSQMVSDKVSYYWETGTGEHPVFEVFLKGTQEEVAAKKEEFEKLLREKNITQPQADVDTEHMVHLDDETTLHRILVCMDFDKMEMDEVMMIADILKDYGKNNYEESYSTREKEGKKLALKGFKWEKTTEDNKIIEYGNYIDGFTPFDMNGNGLIIDTLRVYISVHKKKAMAEIIIYPWKDGYSYYTDEDKINEELKGEIESLVRETPFYQELNKKADEKKNRYFVVTSKNCLADYGNIYYLSDTHKPEYEDFYELENPLMDEGIVTLPTEDVTEIFEEEYKLVLKYAEQNIATNELIKRIIENHQAVALKTEREKEMETKVFFAIHFTGEQMDIESFIRELDKYAQGDIHEKNKIHLNKETYNPMIHLEINTWVYAKDMVHVLEMERKTNLTHKIGVFVSWLK